MNEDKFVQEKSLDEDHLVSEEKNIKDHEMYTEKFGKIKSYRSIKRDGNCMYLSIGIQLINYVRSHPEFRQKWDSFLEKSIQYFNNMKIEEFTYSDYLETIKNLVDNDVGFEDLDKYSLYEIIYFLRLVISAEMRNNSSKYEPFLVDMSVSDYCKHNVEPFFSEAGYIEIGALVEILPLNIEVIDIQEQTENCTRVYGIHDDAITIIHTPNHFEPGYY
ncbi:hypothetical protein P3W45_001183 [Vairimorpha bombi]|jgi:hypothetical protein